MLMMRNLLKHETTVENSTERLTTHHVYRRLTERNGHENQYGHNLRTTRLQKKNIVVTADRRNHKGWNNVQAPERLLHSLLQNWPRHAHIHICPYNRDTTKEGYEIEGINGAFGHKDARCFRIRLNGLSKIHWDTDHVLLRDDCHIPIRTFWSNSDSDKNPHHNFTLLMKTITDVRSVENLLTRPRPKSTSTPRTHKTRRHTGPKTHHHREGRHNPVRAQTTTRQVVESAVGRHRYR